MSDLPAVRDDSGLIIDAEFRVIEEPKGEQLVDIEELLAIRMRAMVALKRAADQITAGRVDALTTTRWNLARHILGDPTV